jgi:glucose-1-phosphate thymidylyltransferase
VPTPSLSTIRRLYLLTGNRCAFPGCNDLLVDDAGVPIAEVCHICADKPGGKRYNPAQTDAERQHYDNLIVLCANHHIIVDGDDITYTAEVLRKMKTRHEAACTQQFAIKDELASLIIALMAGGIVGSAFTRHVRGIASGTTRVRGILLAGGGGRRLYPSTKTISKYLLPVYDKPMIYYPLSVLMLASIREILILSTGDNLSQLEALLGDGSQWGITLTYADVSESRGIGQAIQSAAEFMAKGTSCLILGNTLFCGDGFIRSLYRASTRTKGATIFASQVPDPERYCVVDFDEGGHAISLEEKPATPASRYAMTPLFFFDNEVSHFASQLQPSARGELEVTAIHTSYLNRGLLRVERLGDGDT